MRTTSGETTTSSYADFSRYGDLVGRLLREISNSRFGWFLLQVLYLITGIGAAYVSFLMQKDVFYRITLEVMFAFWIVLILESAKVGTIVVYGFLFRTRGSDISTVTRSLIHSFRILLILLSFTCSLAKVSIGLDRPNLEKVRSEDMQQVERLYSEKYSEIQRRETGLSAMMTVMDQKYDKDFRIVDSLSKPRIAKIQEQLRKEMDNVVNGDFKGPRYRELEDQLEKARNEYFTLISEITRKKATEARRIEQTIAELKADLQAELDRLLAWRNAEISRIKTDPYSTDERAGNRLIIALLRTLNDGLLAPFGIVIPQVMFTCVFSVIVAFLLEMTIYITFYSAVVTFSPKLGLMFAFDDTGFDEKKN